MHLQGGAQHARDSNGPPPPAAPQCSDSQRYISPTKTCQSEGVALLERDSTAAPTPAPLSQKEAGLTSDSPALAAADYLGYAPLSTALAMITPDTTCQPQGAAELERDSQGTPTPAAPQASEPHCEDAVEGQHGEEATSRHEEMVADFLARWHTSRMPLQGGAQDACDSNGPPTPAAPHHSDSQRYFSPYNTCQSQGVALLERDSTDDPTAAAPLSQKEAGLKSDSPALAEADYLGYVPAQSMEMIPSPALHHPNSPRCTFRMRSNVNR